MALNWNKGRQFRVQCAAIRKDGKQCGQYKLVTYKQKEWYCRHHIETSKRAK